MSVISISGERLMMRLLREAGIYGVIFLSAIVAVFVLVRASGMTDIVGYQWKAHSGSGFYSMKTEPISIVTPAWLNRGERLVAHYDADIRAGQINFFVRRGLLPLLSLHERPEYRYVKESGAGELTFVAEEAGFYWPKSRIALSADRWPACREHRRRKSIAERLLVPDLDCPLKSASYSATWTVQQ